jgi:uncharacterized membrane protein
MKNKMNIKNSKKSSISSNSLKFIDNRILINRSIVCVVILALLSLLIGFFSSIGYLESFRIIFGSVFVLFLPGFILSYVFFPFSKPFDEEESGDGDDVKNGGKKGRMEEDETGSAIDWLERFALSFALSIAVVPLIVFYLNLAGIRINLLNVFLEILGIIIISLIILRYRLRKVKKVREND